MKVLDTTTIAIAVLGNGARRFSISGGPDPEEAMEALKARCPDADSWRIKPLGPTTFEGFVQDRVPDLAASIYSSGRQEIVVDGHREYRPLEGRDPLPSERTLNDDR